MLNTCRSSAPAAPSCRCPPPFGSRSRTVSVRFPRCAFASIPDLPAACGPLVLSRAPQSSLWSPRGALALSWHTSPAAGVLRSAGGPAVAEPLCSRGTVNQTPCQKRDPDFSLGFWPARWSIRYYGRERCGSRSPPLGTESRKEEGVTGKADCWKTRRRTRGWGREAVTEAGR